MSPAAFINENIKAKQRHAILEALLRSPVSTIEARERLGIAHPAGRVMELRRAGHSIRTQRGTVPDAQGRLHTSAIYVLAEEGGTHV